MLLPLSQPASAPPPPPLPPAHRGASAPSFADTVRGTQPQAIDPDLALIAQDVYLATRSAPVGQGQWSRVSDAELAAAGITAPLSSATSGFQAAVYSDGDGRYVLAFAGTDFSSTQDWLTNAGQGLGFDTAQYSDAMALAQEVSTAWPGQTVITGHSLGGGLASAASLASGSPAVTFNAAGLSDATLSSLGFNPNGAREDAAGGHVRRYSVQNDVLTGLQNSPMPLPEAVGSHWQIETTRAFPPLDPIRAHQIQAVLQGLAQGEITASDSTPLQSALARPGKAAFDLLGDGVRTVAGLGQDLGRTGQDLLSGAQDAWQDLREGRTFDASFGLVGDAADAGLQTTASVVDRGLDAAGHVAEGAGNLSGGWLRDAGHAIRLDRAGDAAGSWVEGGGQWLGERLDQGGDRLSQRLDAVGDGLSEALEQSGDWVDDRWHEVKSSKWNPVNWF